MIGEEPRLGISNKVAVCAINAGQFITSVAERGHFISRIYYAKNNKKPAAGRFEAKAKINPYYNYTVVAFLLRQLLLPPGMVQQRYHHRHGV